MRLQKKQNQFPSFKEFIVQSDGIGRNPGPGKFTLEGLAQGERRVLKANSCVKPGAGVGKSLARTALAGQRQDGRKPSEQSHQGLCVRGKPWGRGELGQLLVVGQAWPNVLGRVWCLKSYPRQVMSELWFLCL